MFPDTQKEVCFIANMCNQQSKALIIHAINTERSAASNATSCEKLHQSVLQNYSIVQVHECSLMLLSPNAEGNPLQCESFLDAAQMYVQKR